MWVVGGTGTSNLRYKLFLNSRWDPIVSFFPGWQARPINQIVRGHSEDRGGSDGLPRHIAHLPAFEISLDVRLPLWSELP